MARSRRRDDDDDDDDDRPRKKTRSSRDDDDEDDEDEDEAPRRKKRAVRDNDDEDDRPARKKSRARDDDEDEDDEDDDDEDEEERPRKKKKRGTRKSKKKAGSSGPMLLILGLVGGLVLLVGGGIGVWLLFFNENPKSAFEDFQNSWVTKNYGGVYDRIDTDSQKGLTGWFELAKLDPKMAAHKDKKGRELFIAVMEEGEKNNAQNGKQDSTFDRWKKKWTVDSVENTSDTAATLTIRNSDGKTEKVKMVKQDGK